VVSGGLLFISNASHYLANRYFDAKICLIGIAGLNMAIFHLGGAMDRWHWESERRLPTKARLAGGVSILVWLAVVACGRWIGFTM
jgi:Na+/proline symporter